MLTRIFSQIFQKHVHGDLKIFILFKKHVDVKNKKVHTVQNSCSWAGPPMPALE
jgi:hypothetical protein